MLGQTKSFVSEDPGLDKDRLLILRADVGRLPFATGSGRRGGGEGERIVLQQCARSRWRCSRPSRKRWAAARPNISIQHPACQTDHPTRLCVCTAVAAVHAGAAIHCWPNPSAALAEISRVLRPGGLFVASTFLNFSAPLGQLVGDELVAPLGQVCVWMKEGEAVEWRGEGLPQPLASSAGGR